jgi:hypothetical protein
MFSEELLDCVVSLEEELSMTLEEELSMALEDKLSLRIVEEDEAISTALEEDSSSISVSLAEALSLSQATSNAVKAKAPRENLAKFIKTSRINLIGMNVKKVRIAADFFEAFEACDLTKATDDIEYALGNRIEP